LGATVAAAVALSGCDGRQVAVVSLQGRPDSDSLGVYASLSTVTDRSLVTGISSSLDQFGVEVPQGQSGTLSVNVYAYKNGVPCVRGNASGDVELPGQYKQDLSLTMKASATAGCDGLSEKIGLPANPVLWASAVNDVWVVGEAGKIFHWNGSVYQRLIAPTYDGKDLYAVWGSSKDDVWIAGKDNAIVHWDGTALTAPVQTGIQPAPPTTTNWRSIAGAGSGATKIVYFVGDTGAAGFSVPGSPITVSTYTFNCDVPTPKPTMPPNWRSSYCTSLPGFVDCWFGAEDGVLNRYWNGACVRVPTDLSTGITITSIWEGFDGSKIDLRVVGTGGAVRRSTKLTTDCLKPGDAGCVMTSTLYDGSILAALGAGATDSKVSLFLSGPADASEVWVTGAGGTVAKWIKTLDPPPMDSRPFIKQPSSVISVLSGGYADSSGNLLVPGKTPVRMVYLGPLLPTK